MKSIMLSVLFSLILTGCASMGIHPATYEESLNLHCAPLPTNYKEMIKEYVSRSLIDPASGIYEFSETAKAKYNGDCVWYLQVEINAKNRFGGYAGRQLRQFIIYHGKVEEVNAFQSGFFNGMRNY